jgi:hypothetical protein
MAACSDRGVALRFSGRAPGMATLLYAASGAEAMGLRMREGRTYPCKHGPGMMTREDCRRRFLAGDPGCRPGNTPCALGQLAAGEGEA